MESTLTLEHNHLLGALSTLAIVASAPDRWFSFCYLLVASSASHLAFEALHVPNKHQPARSDGKRPLLLHVRLSAILRYPDGKLAHIP